MRDLVGDERPKTASGEARLGEIYRQVCGENQKRDGPGRRDADEYVGERGVNDAMLDQNRGSVLLQYVAPGLKDEVAERVSG